MSIYAGYGVPGAALHPDLGAPVRPLALSLAVTAVVAAVVPATANALSVPETVPTSSYIVTTDGPAAPVLGLVRALGGDIGFVYASALDGFSVSLPAPSLPLSGSLTTAATGAGVKAYVVDTGIRLDHEDFRGHVLSGFDAVDGGPADDCNGHGTHVAGTTGGTRFGVAKGVTLVAVRVLGCDGSGATSGVIAGGGQHEAGRGRLCRVGCGGAGRDQRRRELRGRRGQQRRPRR